MLSDLASFARAGGAASAGKALAAKRPTAARKTRVRRTIVDFPPESRTSLSDQSRALMVSGGRHRFKGQTAPDSLRKLVPTDIGP